jgi:hypothetical protein
MRAHHPPFGDQSLFYSSSFPISETGVVYLRNFLITVQSYTNLFCADKIWETLPPFWYNAFDDLAEVPGNEVYIGLA